MLFMRDKKSKIDAYVRKERRVLVFSSIATVLFSSFLILMFTQPPAGKVSETSGLVKDFVPVPTDYGDKLYLVVELESGQNVQVYIDSLSMYRQGKVVKLQKQEPLFFGKTVYRYRGYKNWPK
jgi:hypothetical protein